MIKRVFFFAVSLLALSQFLCVSQLFADAAVPSYSRAGRWDIGMDVDGVFPKGSDVSNAALYNASISYGINEWFALGVEGGYIDSSIHDDNFSGVPLLVDAIFRAHPSVESPVVLYGVVGLGAVLWTIDRKDDSLSDLKDNTSSFATKLGGGMDWFLNQHWALNFEAAYVFTSNSINVTNNTRDDLDYWTVGGGLKYAF